MCSDQHNCESKRGNAKNYIILHIITKQQNKDTFHTKYWNFLQQCTFYLLLKFIVLPEVLLFQLSVDNKFQYIISREIFMMKINKTIQNYACTSIFFFYISAVGKFIHKHS